MSRQRQPVWLPQAVGQAAGQLPARGPGLAPAAALILGLRRQAGAAEQAAQHPQGPPEAGGAFLAGTQLLAEGLGSQEGRRGTERHLGARLRWPVLNPSLARGRHWEPASYQTSQLSVFFTELEEAHFIPLVLLPRQGLVPHVLFPAVLHQVSVTVIFPAGLS